MTWATPGIALAAAAVVIPSLVILYFLKLRRRSVEVSSTLLWRKAIQDLQANAPFQRLRRNILLLLQLLALALALLAIAQPERRVGEASSSRHVIMIDRSASMAATDGGDGLTRLEAVKKAALEQVEALEPGGLFGADAHEAMVIAFDATAEVVQRFTADKARLRNAIESIAQTDAPGSIREAFQLAQAHRPRAQGDAGAEEGAAVSPAQTFHLFTDGRLPDLGAFLPMSQDSVVYHTAGRTESRNVGITGLRGERAYDDSMNLSIFVALQNASALPASVDVELLLDGTPTAIRPVTVPASQVQAGVESTDPERGELTARRGEAGVGGVVFRLRLAEGAVATVRVRAEGDGLPTDDVGVLVIPPATQTAVAVVTAGNLFLAEALAGLPLAELAMFTPAEFESAVREGRADRYDVVVLDGMLPPNTPVGRALAPGRWLVLGAVPGSGEGLVDRGEFGYTQFLDWRRDHPVLRGLTLDAVRIGNARRLEVPESSAARVIAETPAGPGIVEFVTAEARAIAVLFDIAESNWPFDVSFVVFLASAIDVLDGGAGAGSASLSVRPGEILSQRLPPGATGVTLETPDGGEVPLVPAPDGRVAWGPVRRVGVHTLRWSGGTGPTDVVQGGRATRHVASNLLDPYESDITPSSSVALASRIVQASAPTEATVRRYWRWLLLAALGVVMLEWFVYNRKVHV